MLKKILFIMVVITSCYNYGQTTHNITNPIDIESIDLVAGDTVILADGIYSANSTLDIYGEGTIDNPITFRPQTPGGVVFTGSMRINMAGSYVVIDGFHWKGGEGASNFIQLRAKNFDGVESYAQNCTIQNCVIDGLFIDPDDLEEAINPPDPEDTPSIPKHRWIVLYGNYNNVINCSFMNKASAGALILVELSYNDGCSIVGHTISNNYFYNYEKIDSTLSNSGDSETIRIGTSEFQNYNCATTVSNNYFVQADGENEIITNKSANNVYTNNTFRRCRGSLVLRHGPGATVNKNYFLGENVDGTGGLRIVDSDHIITNNYIQDCVTKLAQAKWNNGLTFMGGSAASVTDCSSSSVSNGYQKSEDNYIANNTIINTNAPLFYNGDKGVSDNTGDVENNLIYFESGNINSSVVMNEDDAGDYADFGETLSYTGNVFGGTTIGIANAGFSEETITLTEDGEIFTHNQSGKGANMGGFDPHTDAMVGNGVGACFLDFEGNSIANPVCTIVEIEKLNVAALAEFDISAGSQTVLVNANVDWIASESLDWVTISPASGDGSGSITVTVEANPNTTSRSGVISFSQDEGELTATLNVNQAAPEVTDLFNLINDTGLDDLVEIHSFSKQQVGLDGTTVRSNYATNTLDKDSSTRWAADDTDAIPSGEIKADGEYIIYDLGAVYSLDLIRLSTDGKADAYGYQLLTSESGTAEGDFTQIIPVSGDLMLSEAGSSDFQQHIFDTVIDARYVKLLGFGRFDSGLTERKSFWTNITEIEFFGTSTDPASADDFVFSETVIYPVPANNNITLKNYTDLSKVEILSIDGKLLTTQDVEDFDSSINVDTSSLSNGIYLLKLSNSSGVSGTKKIVVQH